MNQKKVIILLILSSMMLSSCGATGKSNGKNSTNTVSFPDFFNETINDVVFQTEINFPEEIKSMEITGGTAVKEMPDINKVIDTFVKGKEPSEAYNDEGSGENGETFPTYYAEYSDGSFLSTDVSTIYSTSFATQVFDAFRPEDTSEYNADKYSMENVFSFKKPDAAFSEIKKAITSCGYDISEYDYNYFALDAATMKKEELIYEKASDQKIESTNHWDKSYDCYNFYAQQVFEGIPIFNGTQDFPDDGITNRPIRAIYSKDGIQDFYIDSLYKCSPTADSVKFAEFEDIIRTIADKYGNIITDASYTVTRAQLYFMPHRENGKKYDLIPIWLFEIKESGKDSETGDDFEYTTYSFVNAQSGEEVIF